MRVRFRFYGVFRTAARTNELAVELKEAIPTVRSAISQLVSAEEYASLRQVLFQDGSSDPRPNALIMISGREINTMNGLETTLTEKDDLALLPIAHGG